MCTYHRVYNFNPHHYIEVTCHYSFLAYLYVQKWWYRCGGGGGGGGGSSGGGGGGVCLFVCLFG